MLAFAMGLVETLVELFYGDRPIQRAGTLEVQGSGASLRLGRDRYGVVYVEAESEADAWFGLGFAHGQDRGGQLEVLLRVVRGTLGEVVGQEGLAIDRLARRIGFVRAAEAQLAVASDEVRAQIGAYVHGVNEGLVAGAPAHELALLGIPPTPWRPSDVQAYIVFLCFALAANWDAELVRLRLLAQASDALPALDPLARGGEALAEALGRLEADLAAARALLGLGGGSNAWAVAGARTRTGRPILANDPHLAPVAPNPWYLCRLGWPGGAVAGASYVGTPIVAPGHNGFAAWGITAAHADHADLFLEEVGADGASVRDGDAFVAAPVLEETIDLKGGATHVERILVTPRGPIISPVLRGLTSPGAANAVSLAASWLRPRPYAGLLRVHRSRSFAECRACFAEGSASAVGVVYADSAGQIGDFLAVELPVRGTGHGLVPLPGWRAECQWQPEPVPAIELPAHVDPEAGFVVLANAAPAGEWRGAYLGDDWLDDFRHRAISAALAARGDWDLEATAMLQRNESSLAWAEARGAVLAHKPGDSDALAALEVLRGWDGEVSGDSVGAAVWALVVVEVAAQVSARGAGDAASWLLGRPPTALFDADLGPLRRLGQVVAWLNRRPAGVVDDWDEVIGAALGGAVRRLRRRAGVDPRRWAWGAVRPLVLTHPLGRRWPLSRLFNLGPWPGGGDGSTIAQQAVNWAEPFGPPLSVPLLRAVFDVGAWEECRFALLGGQSGNPFSPHRLDQLEPWRTGAGIAIAWDPTRVRATVEHELLLTPASDGAPRQGLSVVREPG